MQKHLALLGDSIFDNGIYVDGNNAFSDHLARALPEWQITLVAVDGHTTLDIPEQIALIPKTATHIALSVGGNDGLNVIPRLRTETSNVIDSLRVLAQIRREFTRNYQSAMDAIQKISLPLIVCTIYDQVPGLTPELQTALAPFNDTILKEAATRQLPVIDLRCLCNDPRDYSEKSPIEPSSQGGEKIALTLSKILTEHSEHLKGCRLYT
jgi:hypothetical protein